MAFTIRQLQYFVAVAESGTVSGAAQALSISQSAVTEAVKDLEADLGVSLFERHSRGLNITHKGHQFLRHATTILSNVSNTRRAFGEEEQDAGAPCSWASLHWSPATCCRTSCRATAAPIPRPTSRPSRTTASTWSTC